VLDGCVQSSQSNVHLVLLHLVVELLLEQRVERVLDGVGVELLALALHQLHVHALNQLLNFLLVDFWRRVYQDPELCFLVTVVELQNQRLKRGEVIVVRKLSYLH